VEVRNDNACGSIGTFLIKISWWYKMPNEDDTDFTNNISRDFTDLMIAWVSLVNIIEILVVDYSESLNSFSLIRLDLISRYSPCCEQNACKQTCGSPCIHFTCSGVCCRTDIHFPPVNPTPCRSRCIHWRECPPRRTSDHCTATNREHVFHR